MVTTSRSSSHRYLGLRASDVAEDMDADPESTLTSAKRPWATMPGASSFDTRGCRHPVHRLRTDTGIGTDVLDSARWTDRRRCPPDRTQEGRMTRRPPTAEQRRIVDRMLARNRRERGWRGDAPYDAQRRKGPENAPPTDGPDREWTPPWKGVLLEALRGGSSVRAASTRAGICPSTAYDHRRADPEFAEAWALAIEQATPPAEKPATPKVIEVDRDTLVKLLLLRRLQAIIRGR